ncbi:MAG: c-type cytochrome, partial [Verrucomicrobia bacterium]|nr:c-type cytochrome [Verrucomicrobiota bacterium]
LRPWTATDGVRPALEVAMTAGRARLAAVAAAILGRAATCPQSFDAWMRFLEAAPGNPDRGSRVFRSAEAGCIRCHQIFGRGGALGPDLSAIRRGADRGKLLRSLLDPSRDIAPQFADHQVETTGGDRYSGRLLSQEPDGSLTIAHGQDQQTRIPGRLVKSSTPGTLSLMPEGLLDSLSAEEVRDLIAYLESLR